MQTLTLSQTDRAAGGLLWTTPAAVAILDTASFGPLTAAFAAGYGVGMLIYNNWLADRLTF